MKWITRRNAHVDRTACPWMIRKFIDRQAQFFFVDPETERERFDALIAEGAHSFDMRGAEYGHEDRFCTFEVILRRFGLADNRALKLMGHIIRAADIPQSRTRRTEGPGLDALIRGVQLLVADDQQKLRATKPMYDALYAYCQALAAAEPEGEVAPRPKLKHARRVSAPPGR